MRARAAEYQATPSIQHYAILQQERPAALVLSRDPSHAGGWAEEPVSGLDAAVRLPTLGAALPMAELYKRVRFGA